MLTIIVKITGPDNAVVAHDIAARIDPPFSSTGCSIESVWEVNSRDLRFAESEDVRFASLIEVASDDLAAAVDSPGVSPGGLAKVNRHG